MKSKLSNFFSGLLGVIIGCVVTFVAIVPEANKVITSNQSNNSINEISVEKTDTPIEKYDFTNLYKNVAKSAMPSVVGITTVFLDDSSMNSYFDFYFGGSSSGVVREGLGTGVIVDSSGYILTNSHVVKDGQAQKVNVLFNDGTTKEAEVKWYDTNLDLAIIKVDGENYPSAKLGDSDVIEVGDIAIAIGNPLGLQFERTMTQGIISGLGRTVRVDNNNQMSNLLQTDASINEGNSGGPLLNAKGEVIGINTIKATGGEGLGFSIPINTAKIFIDIIKENGEIKEKPVIGIQAITLEQIKESLKLETETQNGVYVYSVYSDSPAEKSGIKKDDIIIKMNDDTIKNMSDLQASLYKYGQNLDKDVTITVERNKKEIQLKVKLMLEDDILKSNQVQQKKSPLNSLFGN